MLPKGIPSLKDTWLGSFSDLRQWKEDGSPQNKLPSDLQFAKQEGFGQHSTCDFSCFPHTQNSE